MATLSDANRVIVRQESSDMFAPYLVDDTVLDLLYTQALGTGNVTPIPLTVWYTIRRMIAKLIAKECDLTEDARKERLNRLEKLQDEWAQEAGIYGGSIRLSVLDVGLDQEQINGN